MNYASEKRNLASKVDARERQSNGRFVRDADLRPDCGECRLTALRDGSLRRRSGDRASAANGGKVCTADDPPSAYVTHVDRLRSRFSCEITDGRNWPFLDRSPLLDARFSAAMPRAAIIADTRT